MTLNLATVPGADYARILNQRLPAGTYQASSTIQELWFNFDTLEERTEELDGFERTRKFCLERSSTSVLAEWSVAIPCILVSGDRAKQRYLIDELETCHHAEILFSNQPLSPTTPEAIRRAYVTCTKIHFYVSTSGSKTQLLIKRHDGIINYLAKKDGNKDIHIAPPIHLPHNFADEANAIRAFFAEKLPPNTYDPGIIKVEDVWFNFTCFKEHPEQMEGSVQTRRITLWRSLAGKIKAATGAVLYAAFKPEDAREYYESKSINSDVSAVFSDAEIIEDSITAIKKLYGGGKSIVLYFSSSSDEHHIEIQDSSVVVTGCVIGQAIQRIIKMAWILKNGRRFLGKGR